jgi:hypothetical protein
MKMLQKQISQTFIKIACILMLVLSMPVLANPCAKPNNNPSPHMTGGVGGTGHGVGGTGVDNDGGIGGTGIQQNNGTGGTGINANGVGGTGIVGVITGFGSLCIGELEVHLDENTPVKVDGVSTKQHQFKVGESVAIEATENNNRISAKNVHVYHQIVGPISEIDITRKEIKVMDQKVSANPEQVKSLSKGQWVGVSGIRNNQGTIEASNITKAMNDKKAMIVGDIVQQSGKLSVNGTEVAGLASSPSSRTAVRVSGAWDGQKLNVEKVAASPAKQLVQRVDQLYIQTYLKQDAGQQLVNIAGESITIKEKTNINTGAPVLVKVNLSNGKPNVQNIQPIQHTILNKVEVKQFEKDDNKQEKHEDHEVENHEIKDHEIEEHEVEHHEVEHPEGIEKPEDVETEKPEKVEIEKPEEIEVEKPEKVEVEKPEKVEIEKPEKVEIEKPEKVEIEKPEKIEIEKPEKIEFEKPEKIEFEKPEKIEFEKPEKIEYEKPEKIEYEKPEDIEYEKPEFD